MFEFDGVSRNWLAIDFHLPGVIPQPVTSSEYSIPQVKNNKLVFLNLGKLITKIKYDWLDLGNYLMIVDLLFVLIFYVCTYSRC